MRLYTVGYEGATLADLLDLLKANGIQRLVDVREAPISRKKGFSKRPLSEALAAAHIRYDLRRELGVVKDVRDRYKSDGDWKPFAAWYEAHLAQHGPEIAAVAAHAMDEPTALLCFEADPNTCHRSILADRLAQAGFEILHLSATDH